MNQPFSQEGMMAYTWTVPERPRSSAGCCFRWWLKLEEVEPSWSKLSTDDLPLKSHLFSDPFFVFSVQWWALSSPVPTTLMISPSPCSKQPWSESSKPWAKTNIFLYVPLSGILSWKLIETCRRTSIFFLKDKDILISAIQKDARPSNHGLPPPF